MAAAGGGGKLVPASSVSAGLGRHGMTASVPHPSNMCADGAKAPELQWRPLASPAAWPTHAPFGFPALQADRHRCTEVWGHSRGSVNISPVPMLHVSRAPTRYTETNEKCPLHLGTSPSHVRSTHTQSQHRAVNTVAHRGVRGGPGLGGRTAQNWEWRSQKARSAQRR